MAGMNSATLTIPVSLIRLRNPQTKAAHDNPGVDARRGSCGILIRAPHQQASHSTRKEQMRYFIDTHDKTKGSFPTQTLSPQQFVDQFDALERAAEEFHVIGHAAHVNLQEGKAFCLMAGPNEESIRRAHEAVNLPYDSITEVQRVTGLDLRVMSPAED
jgi:hypothetical protein